MLRYRVRRAHRDGYRGPRRATSREWRHVLPLLHAGHDRGRVRGVAPGQRSRCTVVRAAVQARSAHRPGVRLTHARPLVWAAVAALAVLFAVAGCGSPAKKGVVPPGSHIVVIVMENKSYEDVVGSRQMPYLNGLAPKAAIPAAIYGTTHPSLPNYLALIGGDTFGI